MKFVSMRIMYSFLNFIARVMFRCAAPIDLRYLFPQNVVGAYAPPCTTPLKINKKPQHL